MAQGRQSIPTPAQLFADPGVSFWLKDALRAGLKRDVVDAAYDAELLAKVLMAELHKVQG